MRKLVLGDVHGGYRALIQCLERSSFDYENDMLISLGDIADGWPETPECVDELLKIKNRVDIAGNHDCWVDRWFSQGISNNIWTQQGGQATIDAYVRSGKITESSHRDFFRKQIEYYVDEGRLFVHGGYVDSVSNSLSKKYTNQNATELQWDRSLWDIAMSGRVSQDIPKTLRQYEEIYIGHTTTGVWNTDKPMNACNVWNLDTGAGMEGKLTIMDIDTKEYWQSDKVSELYPEHKGRN